MRAVFAGLDRAAVPVYFREAVGFGIRFGVKPLFKDTTRNEKNQKAVYNQAKDADI